MQEKEKLTETMMIYGLWQNEKQMEAGLMKLKTKTDKFQALKVQLDFRKKVLQQNPDDRGIFCFSRNKKKLSIEEVCSNLSNTAPFLIKLYFLCNRMWV